MFLFVKAKKASEMCSYSNQRYLAMAQDPTAFLNLEPNFHLCFYNLIDKKHQGKIFSPHLMMMGKVINKYDYTINASCLT